MIRALAVTLLAFALGAVPAQAGWRVQRAQAIAAQVWHHPCEDHVTLSWGVTPDGVVAQAFVDRCEVLFSTEATPWVSFCTTMIHEYGHLAGYRDPTNIADPLHSSDPHSVMAQNTVEMHETVLRPGRKPLYIYRGIDRRCADNGRTYLDMTPDDLAAREEFLP